MKGMPMLRDTPPIERPRRRTATAAAHAYTPALSIDALVPVPDHDIGDAPSETGVAAMRKAFAPSGGLVRADDLVQRMRERKRGDYVALARMIARGEVCVCEWQCILWLPMFQFDPLDLSVRQSARMAIDELGNEFKHWALTAWFARPNAWLADRRPVDVLQRNSLAVLEAACADRYIAAR